MIGIIDYHAGNLGSVRNALDYLGIEYKMIGNPRDLDEVDKIILPGVGHFKAAVNSLKEQALWTPLSDWIKSDRPFLGICLGFQLLFEESEEAPGEKGFGLLSGKLKKFTAHKVPQIGWNSISWEKESEITRGLDTTPYFYFVHSYYKPLDESDSVLATANYGIKYTAAVEKGRIIGVQFHPERSGEQGLRLLKNWVEL